MINKKVKSVEVLCAYTRKEIWEAVIETKKATQGNGAIDTEYIAFVRLGLKENNYRGIITHYAKVKENGIKSNMPNPYNPEKFPKLKKLFKEKGWDFNGPCKIYDLEPIKKRPNPIPHQKGDSARGQIYFCTTLDELKKAKVLSDIKTVAQLEKIKRADHKN